ncbi:VirD2 family relaxase/mobilization nuclease [Sphingorhabdus sp. YGSMI21]|uniref:relaxase/mobilization nuclease domain-containing protein n=1 Tax=Sphingorhabdus sp. YGSMI21 TaxID=2077182 RepID=UPI000C1EF1B0|nr:VirD2 family relaxase/mobilization nuclease [Sphingorhabdus sp. YGSMI21]ATW05680.1 type VI secretion protein [Sphingorhabdus sp. YGSMI21]
MKEGDDLRIRLGRIRSRGSERTKPAIFQAIAATKRAGGFISKRGRIYSPRSSTFGRGRAASVIAGHRLQSNSRVVIVKARVVRHSARSSPSTHLKYLQRDGVTRDGENGKLFGPEEREVDANLFAERCEGDRHHFRFTVAPEDALEMVDLKSFTGELMGQMEKDLGTRLDWTAVDHWNTEHPHIHIIVRGVGDDGHDLVISRDYIKSGMRDRASHLITRELGPRTEIDIRRGLEKQVNAERWTDIDRILVRSSERDGLIDMAPETGIQPDINHVLKVGRLHKLQHLGLANEVSPGQWTVSGDAEQILREIGSRGDIIKRMHEVMTQRGIDRSASFYALTHEPGQTIVGKLVDRGLHDELSGSAYAIVDGIDGRTHHIQFTDIEATSDAMSGAIVELRQYKDRKGRLRTALAVRSDMDLKNQITAPGATWLDRCNLDTRPSDLGGGFGTEVSKAMEDRAEYLVDEGLARRQGQRIIFARGLLDALTARELDTAAQQFSKEMGLPYTPSTPGEYVSGTVRQRLTLASGRFAMIDNGLGFSLVPWTPSLDKQLGQHISGVMRGDGGVDWSLGRGRDLGR